MITTFKVVILSLPGVILLPPQTMHHENRKIHQNDHTFALFDPSKMGSLIIMTRDCLNFVGAPNKRSGFRET